MAKTLARYTVEGGRRAELRDWMEEKQQQQTSSVSYLFRFGHGLTPLSTIFSHARIEPLMPQH